MMHLLDDARRAVDQRWQDARRAVHAFGSASGSTSFVCVAVPELAEAPAPQRPRSLRRATGAMFASTSLSAPPGDSDDSPYMTFGPTLAIGTRGRKRGAVLTDPEEIKELQEAIDNLSPEERENLRMLAHKQMVNSVKTKDGKPLYDASMQLQKELQEEEMGIGIPTQRTLPRYQQDILIRPEKLRPGAEKMQLRKWEEDQMELEFMGNGNVFSPAPLLGFMFGGRRDFAYGVYANTKQVPEVLGERWAKKEQISVISNPQFYRDIIYRAPAMELTLMVIPSRDLPVQEAVASLGPIMQKSMSTLKPTDDDKKALDKFLGMFSAPHLQGAKFLGDNNGPMLKQGSRLIFTCGNKGQTIVEAINPGKIKQQETYQVHNNFNQKVTYSLFDTFIGDEALDPIAKQSVGKGMSYIANGFSFQLNGNPNQVLVDDPNAPYHKLVDVKDWRLNEEELTPSRKLFTLLGVKKEAPLVAHIREAQQGNKPNTPPDVLNRSQ